MNKLVCAILCVSALLLTSFKYRFLTESYIKNNVQAHVVGQQDQINILHLHQTDPDFSKNSNIIEFSAYKYKGEKRMVICSGRGAIEQGILFETAKFVDLSEADINAWDIGMQKAYEELKKVGTNRISELTYVDYTVNEDLFISVVNTATISATVQVWIHGVKHDVPLIEMNMIIGKFKRY